MPKTKTQIANDYHKRVYDRIELQVKKGKKEIIKMHAAVRGESVIGFINRAIDETMQRDKARAAVPAPTASDDIESAT